MYRKVQISVPTHTHATSHITRTPEVLCAPIVTISLQQLLLASLITHRLGFASFCAYINGNIYYILFGVWPLLLNIVICEIHPHCCNLFIFIVV